MARIPEVSTSVAALLFKMNKIIDEAVISTRLETIELAADGTAKSTEPVKFPELTDLPTVCYCYTYISCNADQPLDKLAIMCLRLFGATQAEFSEAIKRFINTHEAIVTTFFKSHD
jgi:hypothetical protein